MKRKLLIAGLTATLLILVQVMVIGKISDPISVPERMGFSEEEQISVETDPTQAGYFEKDGEWYVRNGKGLEGKIIFHPIAFTRMGTRESIQIAWNDGTVSYWNHRPSIRKFSRSRMSEDKSERVVLAETEASPEETRRLPAIEQIALLERFNEEGVLVEEVSTDQESTLVQESDRKWSKVKN